MSAPAREPGWQQKIGAFLNAVWDLARANPVAFLLLVLAVQVIPSLWSRELWFWDELRHGGVLTEMLDHGHWIGLHLSGEFYPDKPPLYFWLLAGLAWVFQTREPIIFFVLTGLSATLMIWATYLMARRVIGRDPVIGLVAGAVLLCNLYFIERSHYPRMDLLFGALIAMSHVYFFMAWRQERAYGWMLAGFLCAFLATMTKGPFGFAFPLTTAVVFLLIQGRITRLWAPDFALGLALCLAGFGLYGLGLYLDAGPEFIAAIAGDVGQRTGSGARFHLLTYGGWIAYRWLPWTLLLLFLPWRSIRDWLRLLEARTRWEYSGEIYLGLSVICSFAWLQFIGYRHHFFILAFYPALAVLTARLLLSLPDVSLRRFAWSLGLVFMVGAALLPVLAFRNHYDLYLPAAFWISALVAVLAVALLMFGRGRLGPHLVVLTLGTTLAIQPHFGWLLPEYDQFKSTKAQASVVAKYIDAGFKPMIFGRSGAMQYYLGTRLPFTSDWETLNQAVTQEDRAIVIVYRPLWRNWPSRPPGLRLVYEPSGRAQMLVAVKGERLESESISR